MGNDQQSPVPLPDDAVQQQLGFGHGGVPLVLLLFYLGFLCFFTWYTLEHQMPSYLEQNSEIEASGASETSTSE